MNKIEDKIYDLALNEYLETGITYTANTIGKADVEDVKQLASDSFFYGALYVIKRYKIQDQSTPSNFIDGQGGEGKAEELKTYTTGEVWDMYAKDPGYAYTAYQKFTKTNGWLMVNEKDLKPFLSQLTAAKAEADALRREVAELRAQSAESFKSEVIAELCPICGQENHLFHDCDQSDKEFNIFGQPIKE